jgi:UDP-glucose 4-epimerase
LLGSINLINQAALHQAKCFVFTSSIAVYGANQTPMAEDTLPRPEDPWHPGTPWSWTRLPHTTCSILYIIFRPHNVYERQNIADKYRNDSIFMNQ